MNTETEQRCPYRAETPATEVASRIAENDSQAWRPAIPAPECPLPDVHSGRRDLRPELAGIIPARMRSRPIDRRGYSIPWFVQYINGEPDFRVMDREKHLRALKFRLCWLCGERLGVRVTFVIGPMCVVNRSTSEPGSHLDCAQYAVRGCPFMRIPTTQYRKANLPEDAFATPGAIDGNPGAMALYTCRDWRTKIVHDEHGRAGILLRLGEPDSVVFWAKGRLATRLEVVEAMGKNLPKLREMAARESPAALEELARCLDVAERYLPPA